MPKGVYPRRKVGRPAKAAPMPEPKVDPRASWSLCEYIDSDPEVIRLNEERKAYYEHRDELKRDITKALHKIRQYEDAINVLEDKVIEYQDCDEDEEKVVHKITGHYAECFAHGFGSVCSDLRDLTIAKSAEVGSKGAEVTLLTKQADENWTETMAHRERARSEWKALQPKAD
jgi:hypothetical protein